jgi:hypothetical protein
VNRLSFRYAETNPDMDREALLRLAIPAFILKGRGRPSCLSSSIMFSFMMSRVGNYRAAAFAAAPYAFAFPSRKK